MERKIFAGPKVRRIRNGLAVTQTAMAEALGISPSYLNLIERNQRPLTVQLLLKLASVYKVDLDDLQSEPGNNLAGLREVFADALLSGELPGDQELVEIAEAAPNAASGVVKLYRAYREQAARLSDLSALMAGDAHVPAAGARLPADEVRDVFERRSAYFAAIEDAAEQFFMSLPSGDLQQVLKDWLQKERGITVRVMPVHVMPDLRRRFERHSMRLFVSERLSPSDQLQEIAVEVATLALRAAIGRELEGLGLSTPEAQRIARFELARSAALAIMMPYEAFLGAAKSVRYDLDLLRSRYGCSFGQAAARLVMLQRPGNAAVPFFLMEVDAAGNRLRRAGAAGFPHARFGGCPKLGIHAALLQPGQIIAETAETPDGSGFLTVSRTLEGPAAPFGERIRRTAVLVGCDAQFRDATVYGQATSSSPHAVAIGPACRLCERKGCLARAEPPVTRPLGLDEMVTGLSAFDFQ